MPQTINHRRLVQEVYDKEILHQMVGVKPPSSIPPKLSTPPGKRATSSREAESSVRKVWGEVDSGLESGEEPERIVLKKQDDKEESRYDIQDKKQPPLKRRRLGTEHDIHTVYTSDEDEEDGLSVGGGNEHLIVHTDISGGSDADSVAAEEAEYAVDGDGDEAKARHNLKRSYWLSKGGVSL